VTAAPAYPVLVTARLELRALCVNDLDDVVRLGVDERGMATLGGAIPREASVAGLRRQVAHWQAHGFGWFRVGHEGAFVGLVGLSRLDFDAGIVPGVEVAWRLAFDAWGRGYATEAARAAIDDGFLRVGLDEVVAITTPGNARSLRVMERLGMRASPGETFEHPRVPVGNPLRTHVLYRLGKAATR
jgi:RimJ/RimL family protein N-acetyltransferase